MAIKKKSKIIITIILLIICSIIGIALVFCIKLKNSYIFRIGNAFSKTINASSSYFVLNYNSNDDELNVNGSIEYNFENLDFLVSAVCNGENLVVDISQEKATIAYFIQSFKYWATIDITEIASEILDEISNMEKKNIEEEFPVQEFLELMNVDEKIDISKYPNKLTKKFIIKFWNNKFLNEILGYEENKNNITTYSINPNVYKLLKEFIKTSKLSDDDKDKLKDDLEKNKKELEMINLTLSISIDKDGYITEFLYNQIEEENIKSINLKLDNINDAKVELEEKLIEKLK